MSVRIAIAEDEAIIRRDLRETLQGQGYTIVGDVGRGDEALALIRETRPDVAILDVKMPGMDGIDVAEALNEELVCAVVLLTAFSERSLVERARDAGVMAYLVKPFQASDLVPSIELARARFDERTMVESELQRVSDQRVKLERRLAARVLLDRAKAHLMETQGLSEPDAFRLLQQRAMNERRPVGDVAREVLGEAPEVQGDGE